MNKDRKITETPDIEELECLIGWPKTSKGEYEERQAIQTYVDLCERIGFGRMNQLAQQIEDIWRNPKKVAYYKKLQKKHHKLCGWKHDYK